MNIPKRMYTVNLSCQVYWDELGSIEVCYRDGNGLRHPMLSGKENIQEFIKVLQEILELIDHDPT